MGCGWPDAYEPSDGVQPPGFGSFCPGSLAYLGWLEVLSFAGFKGSEAFGNRSQKAISAICAVMLLGFGVKFIYDAATAMSR